MIVGSGGVAPFTDYLDAIGAAYEFKWSGTPYSDRAVLIRIKDARSALYLVMRWT